MGSMLRLIDGVLYEGTPSDDFQLTVQPLAHGHAEASVRRCTDWRELRRATPDELECWKPTDAEAEERRQNNRRRGARRATTKVRRLIKHAGLDAMLTLTYRQLQTSLAKAKADLKEFVRRMRRLIPGWQYVTAFELQKRGAWHVHMAIHALPMKLAATNGVKVKSYNVVRAVWLGVVGRDNGNVDQSLRRRGTVSSTAKIAGYLSKYMLKAFEEGDDWSNRYSAGGLGTLPASQRVRFVAYSMAQMIELAYHQIAMHACEVHTALFHHGDTFFLSTSPPLPPRERLRIDRLHGVIA